MTEGSVPNKKLGIRIRRLRKSNNLSQQALAAAVGVHINTVARWELNGVDPGHAKMPLIAAALQCPMAQLVGDSAWVPSEGTLLDLIGVGWRDGQWIVEADPQLPLFRRHRR